MPWSVVAWAALIGLSIGAGFALRAAGWIRIDHLPPLHGHFRSPSPWLLPVAALGAGLWWWLPRVAADRRLPWPVLAIGGWAAAVVWAAALAASDGPGALTAPVLHPTEYLAGLPAAGTDPLSWLRGFAEALPGYPTHVQGHPPLPVLLLWGLRSLGLGGPEWVTAVIIAVGGSAVAAIAVTVRRLAGQGAARRVLPFLVLAPYAVWIATSMDALFLGVGAWGVALLALACPPRGDGVRTTPGAGSMVAAFGGGVLIGALPYLSYGLLPLLALPLAVLIVTRPGPKVITALLAGLLVVPLAFSTAGFWWFDGVMATQEAWAAGAGAHRPYFYFLAGNLAVLGLLTGPAAARALPRVFAAPSSSAASVVGAVIAAGRRQPLFVAALAGVAALDLAGVTRGEVERIWLPYAAWLLTVVTVRGSGSAAGSGSGADSRPGMGGRSMLLAQVATALALQGLVRSPW